MSVLVALLAFVLALAVGQTFWWSVVIGLIAGFLTHVFTTNRVR